MDFEINPDFKDIRHRYYKVGKGRLEILVKMGYAEDAVLNKGLPEHTWEKSVLMQIERDGRVGELIGLIGQMEADLAEKG